jgi:hypothetical protein
MQYQEIERLLTLNLLPQANPTGGMDICLL